VSASATTIRRSERTGLFGGYEPSGQSPSSSASPAERVQRPLPRRRSSACAGASRPARAGARGWRSSAGRRRCWPPRRSRRWRYRIGCRSTRTSRAAAGAGSGFRSTTAVGGGRQLGHASPALVAELRALRPTAGQDGCRPGAPFLDHYHGLRAMASTPAAVALFVEALDPETLALVGREIMQRLAPGA